MKIRIHPKHYLWMLCVSCVVVALQAQTATWVARSSGPNSSGDWFAGANWDVGVSPSGSFAIAILRATEVEHPFAPAHLGSGTVELSELRYEKPLSPFGFASILRAARLEIRGQLTLSGVGATSVAVGNGIGPLGYISEVQITGGGMFLSGSTVTDGITMLSIVGGTLIAADGARINPGSLNATSDSLIELRNTARLDMPSGFVLAAGSRLVFRDQASVVNSPVTFHSSGARIEVRDQADVSQLRIDSFVGSPGTLDISGASGAVEIKDVSGPISINLGTNQLTFSGPSRNVDLAGAISGSGGIVWNNPGRLSLVSHPTRLGANSYTGSTDILQGIFTISGVEPSHTNIGAPATMLGTGAVRGNLLNSGTLRPGDAQHVLTGVVSAGKGSYQIAGDFTQTSTGVLRVDVGSIFGDDQLLVAGNATLGGQLQYSVGSNLPPVGNLSRTLLTAALVQGQFANIAALTPVGVARPASVAYLPGSVELRFLQRSFTDFASDRDEAAVAAHIDATLSNSTGEYRTLLGQLNLLSTGASVQNALESLAPDRYAVLPGNAFLAAAAQQAARDRLFAAARENPARGFDLFFEAGRRTADFDAVGGMPAAESVASTGTVGGVWRNGGFALGASLAQEKGDVDLDVVGSRADLESRVPSAFFQYAGEKFFLTVSGVISRDEYTLRRRVVFSGFDQTATATVSGSRGDFSLMTGTRFTAGKWKFAPQAGVVSSRWEIDRFTETGAAGANMSIGEWTVRSLRTRVGLEAAGTGGSFVPRLAVHWWRETDDDRALPAAFAGATGSAYRAPGRPADENTIQATLGFDWRVGRNAVLHATLAGARGDHSRVTGDFSAGFRWSF